MFPNPPVTALSALTSQVQKLQTRSSGVAANPLFTSSSAS